MNAKEVLAVAQTLSLHIRSTADHANITPPEFQRIVGTFKTLGMTLNTFECTIHHAGLSKEMTRPLMQTLTSYREAVTGGSFTKDPIGPESLARYEAIYQTFVQQVNIIILDIIRE